MDYKDQKYRSSYRVRAGSGSGHDRLNSYAKLLLTPHRSSPTGKKRMLQGSRLPELRSVRPQHITLLRQDPHSPLILIQILDDAPGGNKQQRDSLMKRRKDREIRASRSELLPQCPGPLHTSDPSYPKSLSLPGPKTGWSEFWGEWRFRVSY